MQSPPPSSSSSSWIDYQKSVQEFLNVKRSSDPGYFCKNLHQQHYEICRACPLEGWRYRMPILTLPLRIHLIRSSWLGCSREGLNQESIPPIVEQINAYWEPAGIRFDLIAVEEQECTLPQPIQEDLKLFITNKLRRGKDGKTMHQAERRRQFLDVLLPSFERPTDVDDTAATTASVASDGTDTTASVASTTASAASDGTDTTAATTGTGSCNFKGQEECQCFDIWFLDMVGHQIQGVCIDRASRTILMGERSTKGYSRPTPRPHSCLAKTAAHTLGLALSLNHPRYRRFEDGTPQILTAKENLMAGGQDRTGGGGFFLENWQISAARASAERVVDRNASPPPPLPPLQTLVGSKRINHKILHKKTLRKSPMETVGCRGMCRRICRRVCQWICRGTQRKLQRKRIIISEQE